ncbi:GIN domain-containing protein [Flagellimonas iocasae]|uniref:GIN domain-containing protein n=1 Tax=Flagellimonas iocasae TaxID=2055905 RepID=A0ABW4XZY5_9FLAO
MKKILVVLLLIVPMIISAQRKPRIKGSRIVTEVNEELPPFNAVVLNDNLDIVLKKSFGPGYELVADDNLIDILKFEVQDGTLVISSYYDVTAKKQLDITVTYTELRAITVKDGSIRSEDVIQSDELFVDGFNNTRLDIKASASVMDINLENTSHGDFNVDVDSLNITIGNRADAYVYAVNETSLVDLENDASLTLEGTSSTIQARLVGNSKYRGETMEAGMVKVTMEDDPSANVYAHSNFELSAKGRSRVYLYGTPKVTILEFLDTAQLIKKEE